MSQEIQESISLFVDGELDVIEHEELIGKLLENETQKQVWGRYCVMSDAIKKTLPESLNHNLLARVQDALASEPALLAPTPRESEIKSTAAEVVKLPKKSSRKPSFNPALGFGIAASLTLAFVVGFQMKTATTNDLQQVALLPGAPSVTLSATTSKVLANTPATQQFTIASKPVTSNSMVSDASVRSVAVTTDYLKPNIGDAIYAEQSLIDDGRWTRITQIDGIPLESHFLSGKSEAHVQYKLQGNQSSLVRSVKLEKASTE